MIQPLPNTDLYEKDFYAWTQDQARRLRQPRRFQILSSNSIDWEHIAEEIEDLGRGEKRELVRSLTVLLCHLLKWRYQPGHRSKSWRLTLKEQRICIERILAENPSLRSKIENAISSAYEEAVVRAGRETDLDEQDFPSGCEWSSSQIMDRDFCPDDHCSNRRK
jgi:hypothetical protein